MSRYSVLTPLQAKKFPRDELIDRAFRRVAMIICEWQEESPGFCPTNILCDPLISNEYVLAGESARGAAYNEHVVPRIYLCNEAIRMFTKQGAGIDQVAAFLRKFLHIVRITKEEQQRLDEIPGLKEGMPFGWSPQTGGPYARLEAAMINWAAYDR